MATHLREAMAAQTAADICADIAAGLDADSETKDLAPLWDALAVKGDGLAASRRTFERTLGRARARVGVLDVVWDFDAGAFARDVLNESHGRRDEAPNTRFFAKVPASEAQSFGIAREVEQGRAWIQELGRDPSEALADRWIPRLTKSTDALEAAGKDRSAAMSPLAMHGMTEVLYVEEINIELDKLEGTLKQRFPRQPKRIAAYVDPTKPKRSRKDEDEGSGESSGE